MAIADLETRWARPLEVIDAHKHDPVTRLGEIVADHSVERVVVGKPVGLSGRSGPAMDAQRAFVAAVRAQIAVPVEEFDERLTTVAAERRLREGGASPTKRKEIKDAVAAQLMLQDYLDSRR